MANILGKDRDVNKTISIVKKILENIGFNLEEKELLNPVDNIWSVNLQDRDSQFYTNGKGSTKENCLASAYCEFLERLGSGFFFNDYAIDGLHKNDKWVFSPDETYISNVEGYKNHILTKELFEFYDPENLLEFKSFIDSGRCKDDFIISLPFKNDKNSDIVNFPIELLKTMYASNGLSAGNTEYETLVQGMCECMERGVKNYIIREGLSLPDIDDDYLNQLGFLEIKESIESYGYPVIVKDASLNGRFPVICVLLINQENGTILSSFGCHPILSVAIDRTLTELLQGRKLESLEGFSTLSNDSDEVADEANIESHFINSSGVLHLNIIKKSKEKCKLWEFNNISEDEISFLKNILNTEGYEYYFRSTQIQDMWVSQTIIPRLSEIYPIEDLEYEYKNRASVLREFMKFECEISWIQNSISWFDESYISGNDYVMEYMGISIDDNESLSNLLVYEIELLMLIKLMDFKKMKTILSSQLNFESVDKGRVGFWRCILSSLLEMKLDNLKMLYGKNTLNFALKTLKGEIPRELFPLLGEDFSEIEKHRKFNGVYNKYRQLLN